MQRSNTSTAAVVVAAGSGVRAGGGEPKQWRLLGGRPVARWSLDALAHWGASPLVLVISPGSEAVAEAVVAGLNGVRIVRGGHTRAASVRAGLAALEGGGADQVLIHDAARPFLRPEMLDALSAALADADAVAPALPLADTLKEAEDSVVIRTPARDNLWRVQTPQAFRSDRLRAAVAALPADAAPTDDLAVVEAAGGRVRLVPGDPELFKLTHPEDFTMAERLLGDASVFCTGHGFDAHRFGPGEGVWLCGVLIPSDRTLLGHSDADAGLHALTDAVLGAVAAGDIGDHFPPSDPKWRGAASDQFLLHALELVAARGGRLVHVDVTLICEAPRVKPHREAMRARLAELCRLPLERVSVKATTTERMGFTGREEGLAAQATATVRLPA